MDFKNAEFRVKTIPDPQAFLGGKSGGEIKKDELLKLKGIKVEMQNFDFDLIFEITQFTISATVKGYVREYTSKSAKLTPEMISLIHDELLKGMRFYIQDIKCIGIDGVERDLAPLAFKIK